jgi:hypothetical protein
MVLFAPFWVEHRHTLHLFVTGIMLHAYALMLILMAARNMHLVKSIDYATPVLAIQRQIARLYAWRLREAWWFGAVGCLIWVPFVLYVFALMGADLYVSQPMFVAINALCGLACLAVFLWLTMLLRRRSSRWARAMDNSAVGASVRRARLRLEELARFENE